MVLVERTPGAAAEAVGQQVLVVDPQGRRVLTLSRTGSIVWEAIDGQRDIADLARHLARNTTGCTLEQAQRDVELFVDSLVAAGVVQRIDASG